MPPSRAARAARRGRRGLELGGGAVGGGRRFVARGGIVELVVGGEQRRQPARVAAVDEVVEHVGRPRPQRLRAQLVDHQHLGVLDRREQLVARERRVGIDRALQVLHQRGEVDEAAAHAVGGDQLAQRGDGEVRLARAEGTGEQQPAVAKAQVFAIAQEVVDVATAHRDRAQELRPAEPGRDARSRTAGACRRGSEAGERRHAAADRRCCGAGRSSAPRDSDRRRSTPNRCRRNRGRPRERPRSPARGRW